MLSLPVDLPVPPGESSCRIKVGFKNTPHHWIGEAYHGGAEYWNASQARDILETRSNISVISNDHQASVILYNNLQTTATSFNNIPKFSKDVAITEGLSIFSLEK